MLVSQHTILQELKKLNYDAQVQENTNQIYIILKHEKKEFPLFLRIVHEGDLLQLMTFIPCDIKQEQYNDLSRFLHMLNKELDVPGFGVDEQSGTVFYRVILPAVKKQVSEETFESLIKTSNNIVTTFSPVIEMLALGYLTMEEILKKAAAEKALN